MTFSNSSKATIINSLALTFEKQDIELPNWPTLLNELDSYEVSVSPSGLMTYNAGAGGHDDTVIALALANAAAAEYAVGSIDIRFLEELPKDKALEGLDRYYQDLLIDSEADSPF
jgi:phage FluMu gp28-like protein